MAHFESNSFKVITLTLLCISLIYASEEVPRLNLTSWNSIFSDFYADFETNPDGTTTITVPSTEAKLNFSCNSTYPTTWSFSYSENAYGNGIDRKVVKLRNGSEDFKSYLTLEYREGVNVGLNFSCCAILHNYTIDNGVCSSVIYERVNSFSIKMHLIPSKMDVVINSGPAGEGRMIDPAVGNPKCLLNLKYTQKEYQCQHKDNALIRFKTPICQNTDFCEFYRNSDNVFNCPEKNINCTSSGFIFTSTNTSDCKKLFVNPKELPDFKWRIAVCDEGDYGEGNAISSAFMPNLAKNDIIIYRGADTDFSGAISVKSNTLDMYLHQESSFKCQASATVFARGFNIWYLKYSDGRSEFIAYGRNEITNEMLNIYEVSMKVKLESADIAAIVCSAPLWNSFKYINSTLPITVKAGMKPKIVTTPQRIDPFSLFKIPCEAVGDPQPEFQWIFGKAALPKPFVIPGRFSTSYGQNWTEFESFIQVGKEYENFNLSCFASNFLGHDEIIFLSLFKKPTWPYFISGSIGLALISGGVIALLIRKIRRSRNRIRYLLSQEEINQFHNGNEALVKENSGDPSTQIEHMPYNTNYEIPKEDIFIEHDKILGEGAYGIVVRGKLKKQTKNYYNTRYNSFDSGISEGSTVDTKLSEIPDIFEGEQEVAIKTIKPHSGTQYLKTLLFEIKLMIFIKEDPNIVKFLGALTGDLVKGRVFMVFEYCTNGNLLEFLRRHRYEFQSSGGIPTKSIFFSQSNEDESDAKSTGMKSNYVKMPRPQEITLKNLFKWGRDIASGVDYLHRNKIIHADLATRNILVNSDLTAKITDFGLSRHLYEYSNYVKQSQEPMPWRWMSIESLKDMTFSLKSDVWSYAITLWEIFTLGEVPYPGYTWNPMFLESLINGMRMSRPQFSPESLYDKMMTCWEIDATKRPDVLEFVKIFSDLLDSNMDNFAFNTDSSA